MFSITFDSTTSSIMAGKNQKKKKNQLCAEETAHTFHGEEHNAEPTGVSEKRKMQEEV